MPTFFTHGDPPFRWLRNHFTSATCGIIPRVSSVVKKKPGERQSPIPKVIPIYIYDLGLFQKYFCFNQILDISG